MLYRTHMNEGRSSKLILSKQLPASHPISALAKIVSCPLSLSTARLVFVLNRIVSLAPVQTNSMHLA